MARAKMIRVIDGHCPGDLILGPRDAPIEGLTSIGGIADLRGYAHALPLLASIGDGAYLGGYAHAYHAGKDKRGYHFAALRLSDSVRVFAGCRNFSPEQASAHWGVGRPRENAECLALAEKAIKAASKEGV